MKQFKDVGQALELVFGSINVEIEAWVEGILAKDPVQVVGVLATVDRAAHRLRKKRMEDVDRGVRHIRQYSSPNVRVQS